MRISDWSSDVCSSDLGAVMVEGVRLPVVGRVSMDLLIIDLTAMPELEEGDWVKLDYEPERASAQSGLSQYELLTGLGNRLERSWSSNFQHEAATLSRLALASEIWGL